MTMGLWAALCLVLFLIAFSVSKERIHPKPEQKTPPKQDFADLLGNGPWKTMFCLTLIHFSLIALMGSAQYSYYNYYADKAAFFDWLQKLHLTAPALAPGAAAPAVFSNGWATSSTATGPTSLIPTCPSSAIASCK